MIKKAFILTEGGKNIGFGHVARCLSLYQAFEEEKVTPEFIINGDYTLNGILKGIKHCFFDWLRDENKLFRKISGAEIVVIDSYLAKISFYEILASLVRQAVYVDDYKRFDYPKGIVVNGSIYAKQMHYPKKKDISYLLGPQYISLRKEFWHASRHITSSHLKKIMITFGGNDQRNLTMRILKLVERKFPDSEKVVIIGNGFKNIKLIKNIKDEKTTLVFFPDAEVMKVLMQDVDVTISAGGQTLYELARMGIPTIGICVAQNQFDSLKQCQRMGFLLFVGLWDEKGVLDNVERGLNLLKSKQTRERMSKAGRHFVDGRGAIRVVKQIINRKFY